MSIEQSLAYLSGRSVSLSVSPSAALLFSQNGEVRVEVVLVLELC